MSENLRRTPTNSSTESEGMAFGLAGNLVIPIAISLMVSAALAAVVIGSGAAGAMQWLIVLLPSIITAAYIVLLKNDKKPRFEQDFWELLLEGAAFHTRRRRSIRHPIVNAEEIAASKKRKK